MQLWVRNHNEDNDDDVASTNMKLRFNIIYRSGLILHTNQYLAEIVATTELIQFRNINRYLEAAFKLSFYTRAHLSSSLHQLNFPQNN